MSQNFKTLEKLYVELKKRAKADPKKSYTAALLKGGAPRAAKKFGEEATELVIAALTAKKGSEGKKAVRLEAADVLYHFIVLLMASGVKPAEVMKVLQSRMGTSGHVEKASRKKKGK